MGRQAHRPHHRRRPAQWERTEIYRKHADLFGIRAIICSIDIQPVTGIIDVISLRRSDLHQQFSEADRRLKEFVAPHLFETCRHNRLLYMHRTHAGGEEVLHAPAITHGDGLLLEADPRFVELLHEEWPGWHGGRLPGPLLASFVEQGLETHVGRRAVIRARRSGELVLLTARGKQGSDALTARECSIAEMYVAGHSHKQVAEQLHLSPATVKAHLRRIYSKLSINNKTQLLRMMSYD